MVEASGTPDASALAAASSVALAAEAAASAASVHAMLDHGMSAPTKSSKDLTAAADAAALAAAEAAMAAQEAAAEAKRTADAARLAAAAAPVVTGEDMVPRTDAAISDPAALRVMQVSKPGVRLRRVSKAASMHVLCEVPSHNIR